MSTTRGAQQPARTMRDAAPDMLAALEFAELNAELAPDPRMDGLADCYLVTIDDLNAIRAAINKARGRQ